MSACGYKFYLRVFNYISLRYRVEHETRIKFVSRSGSCNILFIMYRPIARCCCAIFVLAETEVAMTTVITSQVKNKNCIFTGYQIFVTGKILVFHRCLYNTDIVICFSVILYFSK